MSRQFGNWHAFVLKKLWMHRSTVMKYTKGWQRNHASTRSRMFASLHCWSWVLILCVLVPWALLCWLRAKNNQVKAMLAYICMYPDTPSAFSGRGLLPHPSLAGKYMSRCANWVNDPIGYPKLLKNHKQRNHVLSSPRKKHKIILISLNTHLHSARTTHKSGDWTGGIPQKRGGASGHLFRSVNKRIST